MCSSPKGSGKPRPITSPPVLMSNDQRRRFADCANAAYERRLERKLAAAST